MRFALAIVAIYAGTAHADRSAPPFGGAARRAQVPASERDLCAPNARHHGATIDLDVKLADIHDVLRLLADVAHANLVVANDVAGKITLRLQRVPWDAAICTIAAAQHLTVTVEDNVLLVRRAR